MYFNPFYFMWRKNHHDNASSAWLLLIHTKMKLSQSATAVMHFRSKLTKKICISDPNSHKNGFTWPNTKFDNIRDTVRNFTFYFFGVFIFIYISWNETLTHSLALSLSGRPQGWKGLRAICDFPHTSFSFVAENVRYGFGFYNLGIGRWL